MNQATIALPSGSCGRIAPLHRHRTLSVHTIAACLLALSLAGVWTARAAEPVAALYVDRIISESSSMPPAVDPVQVGHYPGATKSGGGYFYDAVLEYRVWMHPERGATPLAGDSDYFAAFADYDRAAAFSRTSRGSEEPLVLVRQLEYIAEPKPGRYVHVKQERITEWRVKWLKDAKRQANSIEEFLANPPPVKK